MQNKSKQEHPDLKTFKNMAMWLLAYKLFRDYLELLRFGYRPEPEKFFEVWSVKCLEAGAYSKREVAGIWKLFVDLLVARAESLK